jgi:hypothetical protein
MEAKSFFKCYCRYCGAYTSVSGKPVLDYSDLNQSVCDSCTEEIKRELDEAWEECIGCKDL